MGSFVEKAQSSSGNLPLSAAKRHPRFPFSEQLALLLIFLIAALQLSAKDKDGIDYGAGLIVNVPFTEAEVAQVVQEVVQNGIIRGTKEYNKDEYITGATAASSSKAFPEWTGGGKVFYKVRLKALDPRNFKNGADVGTLTVRYIVQAQGEKNAVLRINAIFVEDFRHSSHPSNGSVESAEYKDIHDQLDALDSIKQQTAEALQEKEQQRSKNVNAAMLKDAGTQASTPIPAAPATEPEASTSLSTSGSMAAPPNDTAQPAPQTLEEHVKDLRRQVERLVKSPGAALKSAPFHTASTLQSLPTGTEVLVVVSTTYWLGVETHDGQHGWILRDELELLP